MRRESFFGIPIPVPKENKDDRDFLNTEGICPECGGDQDTGWECNECGFDAKSEVVEETT